MTEDYFLSSVALQPPLPLQSCLPLQLSLPLQAIFSMLGVETLVLPESMVPARTAAPEMRPAIAAEAMRVFVVLVMLIVSFWLVGDINPVDRRKPIQG